MTELAVPLSPVWIGSPNFAAGRGGMRPEAVVIHVTEGALRSVDDWFRNPASKVSAHYCIARDGRLHQYVREEDTAWHAGRVLRPTWRYLETHPGVNPNRYTIGIEHEGTADQEWTDAQYERSGRLVGEIAIRWQIPLDAVRLTGHHAIFAEKTCPGRGDVGHILELARWRAAGALD